MHHVQKGSLTGLDIEDINPPLRQKMLHLSAVPIPSDFKSLRKTGTTVDSFEIPERGLQAKYYAADVFDPAVWNCLAGRKFNLIFSDAFHNPDAILFEWEQIMRLHLLDESGFTMIWDDLVSKEIRHVFNTIVSGCIGRFGLGKRNACLMHMAGWVGDYEDPHPIGMISSQGFIT